MALSTRQQNLLEQIDLGLRPQSMKLRRLLMTENMQRSLEIEGASLNTSAICDTYMSIKRNIENRDRYETYWRIPSVKCGFSFAIDFSGSMNTTKKPTTWEMVLSTAYAVGRMTQTMGVESNCSIVGVDNSHDGGVGSTDYYTSRAVIIKDIREKWSDDLFCDSWSFQPCTGTYVSQYIQVAIDMAKRINAQKRVAFFLTDGEDPGVYSYLQSLVDLAKAQSVHLIGIVFTSNYRTGQEYSRRIPKNIIVVDDPKTLGQKMIKTIEGLFPKR